MEFLFLIWCLCLIHKNVVSPFIQVAAKKQTLKNVTDHITDIVCKRAELGYNYGVILIPEGLIDFIPEVIRYPHYLCSFRANESSLILRLGCT